MRENCYLCGTELSCGDVRFAFEGRCVCCDCADGVTTEELMHITGARSTRGMLMALGFVREAY